MENEHLLPPEQEASTKSCEKIDVDALFIQTVPFGKFQVCMQISAFCLIAMVAYQQSFTYFIGDNPSWTCLSKNSSEFCNSNFAKEIQITNVNFTVRCKLARDEWMYTTSELYSYVTEFDLVCSESIIASIAGGVFFIGSAVAAVLCGILADIYGRKPIILVSLVLTVIVSVATSYVSKVWELIALRGLNGATQPACMDIVFVMMSEFIIPRHRPISANICLLAISVSGLLSDVAAYFEKEWRKLQLYCSLPCLLFGLVFVFIPESPRWLLGKGKVVKAEKVFKEIGKMNAKRSLQFKLNDPSSLNDMVKTKHYVFFDLLKNVYVIKMVVILGFIWLTVGLTIFTSMLEMSNFGGDIYTNYALSVAIGVPTCFFAIYLCNRFGRKITVLVPMMLSGIVSVVVTILLVEKKADSTSLIILTVLMKFLASLAFNSLYLWTFELYPTVVRLRGMSFAVVMLQLGFAAAPFLTIVLQSVSVALPYFIMCILNIVSTFLGMALEDTNNLPTREDFEDIHPSHDGSRNVDVIA